MRPVTPVAELPVPILFPRIGPVPGPRRSPLRLGAVLAVVLCVLAPGCSGPEKALQRHQDALESGQHRLAEEALRSGLEDHPGDIPLLCAAASFYLRPDPAESYTPRLALHYAMRADQAAGGVNPDAARLLGMAHRAAGGLTALPEGEALLAAGLEALGHPDAGAPQRLRPFDSDLLDPTLANLLEQKARWEKGRIQPTCPPEQLLVPAGQYPIAVANLGDAPPSETELALAAFCIGRLPATEPGCSGEGERGCSSEEITVVRAALKALLWGDPTARRCCAEPLFARVKPQ
jgi:hypothetical protein